MAISESLIVFLSEVLICDVCERVAFGRGLCFFLYEFQQRIKLCLIRIERGRVTNYFIDSYIYLNALTLRKTLT